MALLCFAACSLESCRIGVGKSDADSLDRLAHAYTDLLNSASSAEAAEYLVAPEPDRFGYWSERRHALDSDATNTGRLRHAVKALDLNKYEISKSMEAYRISLDEMDKAVQRLVEIANSIQKPEYRADAVEIAKTARETHSAMWDVELQLAKNFQLQTNLLRDIAEGGGGLPSALVLRRVIEDDKTINLDLQTAGDRSRIAVGKLKDAFSALKGKSSMKEYPVQDDSGSARSKSSGG